MNSLRSAARAKDDPLVVGPGANPEAEDQAERASGRGVMALRASLARGKSLPEGSQDLGRTAEAASGDEVGTPGIAETSPEALIEPTGFEAEPTPSVRSCKPRKRLEHAQAGESGDFSSDDPSSPNYRFRDTGYVPGSRKEMAALYIRTEAREGRQVKASAIDWEMIEQNPREARALITKSNLFGTVDWEALRAGGMEPGAGFLVDRVYAAIGKEPEVDNPQARRDYAVGLEALRERLEGCKTPDEVVQAVDRLKAEYEAVDLDAAEQAAYEKAEEGYAHWMGKYRTYKAEESRLDQVWTSLNSEITNLNWDQERRLRRKWKPDPEIDARIALLIPQRDAAHEARMAWREANPDAQTAFETRGDTMRARVKLWVEAEVYADKMKAIKAMAAIRNMAENPLCRAWAIMGQRFLGILTFRSHKGSDAFQNHVTTARNGKIKDWSWAEKEVVRVATSTRESVRFQLQVADRYERVGGDFIKMESSSALKDAFGLREVEFGLWVAEDFSSAKFHTEQCGEGYADLADLLGIDRRSIGLHGQLAMGFGSRGHGAMGWRTSAPAASYFPRYRVTNLTKHAGGGTLGHEWFHALDNIIPELQTGKATGEDVYASEDPDGLLAGPLRDAMKALVKTMMEGHHRHEHRVAYAGRDVLRARHNIDRSSYYGSYGAKSIPQRIKEAGNVHDAVIAVKDHFSRMLDRDGNLRRKAKMDMKDWITVAAAYYGGAENGGEILVKAGNPTSRFAYEAVRLDGDSKTPYWSKTREMAARAFQAWCEDRLRGMGRQNDYLSWHADNKYYVDPLFGPLYPFPEGEERDRINRSFDELFRVVRELGVLGTN